MKALILAAGRGTRLRPLTDSCPKSMVELHGKPIIIKQIENLVENGITDITVIAGYKAEVLASRVKANYPFVNIVVNSDYATTNNMVSAYMGREAIGDDPFIMMNADVFFDGSIIGALLSGSYSNAIATDIGRYLPESMKVTEKEGRLARISKDIAREDALGASIDIYRFSPEAGRAFFASCEEFILMRKEMNLWSEVAINEILKDVHFSACPLNGRWFEIDNHDDLEEAHRLFSA